MTPSTPAMSTVSRIHPTPEASGRTVSLSTSDDEVQPERGAHAAERRKNAAPVCRRAGRCGPRGKHRCWSVRVGNTGQQDADDDPVAHRGSPAPFACSRTAGVTPPSLGTERKVTPLREVPVMPKAPQPHHGLLPTASREKSAMPDFAAGLGGRAAGAAGREVGRRRRGGPETGVSMPASYIGP